MNSGKVLKLIDKINIEILKNGYDLLEKHSPQKYIESINNYPHLSSYQYTSDEVKKTCNDIITNYGQIYLECFHKLILLNLILKTFDELYTKNFPEDILSLYRINLNRIQEEIETNHYKGNYLYSNDKFCKDIALCSMRLIPAGAQKIHLTALSKRFLLTKGLMQFIKAISFILFELKGLQPLYAMHTDSNDPYLMNDFNENGWVIFYKRVAMILKINKSIKGVFGSSWFFDPALENISPRLIYLRKIVTDNGGKLFYLGTNEQSIRDATLKSETRRKMYEERKYLPTSYLLIWPREKLIRWSENVN